MYPPLMKCIFEQVAEEGVSISFEAYFYGDNVTFMGECLEKAGSSQTWVMFSNTNLTGYCGTISPWSPLTVKVRPKPDIKILVVVASPNKPKSLTAVKHGTRQTVFVVVKEILKHTTTLSNGNRHTILLLIDPSCIEKEALMPDLLLHIFFNNRTDDFVEPIVEGDILLVSNMLGDYYNRESKMHGKIFNSQSIVNFKVGAGGKVRTVSSNLSFKPSEQDLEMAKELQRWWEEVKVNEQVSEDVPPMAQDAHCPQSMICDITQSGSFVLYCVVRGVCVNSALHAVALRVTDGTTPAVTSARVKWDLPARVPPLSEDEIEVLVEEPHLFTKAAKLKTDDFVRLTQVTCTPASSSHEGGASPHAFKFRLRGRGANINHLHHDSRRVIVLKRLVDSVNSLWKAEREDLPVPDCSNLSYLLRMRRKEAADGAKCDANGDKESNRSLYSYPTITTDCSPFPGSSLTRFFEDSLAGDRCRVWVFLKHIHVASVQPFTGCQCVVCFHDWVCGLCSSCGCSSDSASLRSLYSQEDLSGGAPLHCTAATCESPEGSVLPSIRLVTCLKGAEGGKEFPVRLSGQAVELFFGVSPSFGWTVGPPPPELEAKVLALQHMRDLHPLQVCLVNCLKADGTGGIQITSTAIKET